MMKVAALYDIHGNAPALEAVLGDVMAEGVDLVVMGGDLVPGPEGEACAELLRGLPCPVRSIRGNGEGDVLDLHAGVTPGRVPEPFLPLVRWSVAQLSDGTLDDMASWPSTTSVRIPELGTVMFCHATPRDDNEIFTRLTPEERLTPVFQDVGASLVVCGHTHMPFDRRVGEVRVVNAGSVGLPFGGTGAFWLMLDREGVSLRRTGYDLHAAASRIAASGYPGDFEVRNPPSEADMLELFEAGALR